MERGTGQTFMAMLYCDELQLGESIPLILRVVYPCFFNVMNNANCRQSKTPRRRMQPWSTMLTRSVRASVILWTHLPRPPLAKIPLAIRRHSQDHQVIKMKACEWHNPQVQDRQTQSFKNEVRLALMPLIQPCLCPVPASPNDLRFYESRDETVNPLCTAIRNPGKDLRAGLHPLETRCHSIQSRRHGSTFSTGLNPTLSTAQPRLPMHCGSIRHTKLHSLVYWNPQRLSQRSYSVYS